MIEFISLDSRDESNSSISRGDNQDRDLDEAIEQSKSFQEVVQRLQLIGYQVIQRDDDLLIKGEGIYRYLPSADLGKLYSINMIRQRLTDNKDLLHNESNYTGNKRIP